MAHHAPADHPLHIAQALQPHNASATRLRAALRAGREGLGIRGAPSTGGGCSPAPGPRVEIGAGLGSNFRTTRAVTEVVALEPEPHLRGTRCAGLAGAVPSASRRARRQPAVCGWRVRRRGASLVLCTVPDQRLALAELHRAIRPGGELRFYEHVRSGRRGRLASSNSRTPTLWPHLAGGCNLARDTAAPSNRPDSRSSRASGSPTVPRA